MPALNIAHSHSIRRLLQLSSVSAVFFCQVVRKEHQWAVKKKFYEADVESKRIFEEALAMMGL